MSRLVTLGRLALDDGSSTPLARRRKELALLAYLAWHAPRPVPRGRLATLFWGSKDEARARQSLRQALLALRGAVGDALLATPDDVALDARAVAVDAREFLAALDAGDLADAVSLWTGDFLADAEDLGEEEFRSWLEAERVTLRARLAGAYERLVDDSRASGRPEDEVSLALAWTAALPFDEKGQHRLVDALRHAGRTAEARARHAAFSRLVREELGAEPSAAFLQLGRSLDGGEGSTRVGARALLTPDLVGRAGTLGRLTDAWRRVRGGESVVVVIRGDEGMGRSRTCRELARTVRESGKPAIVLEGRAFESERERPFAALRDALGALAEAPGLIGAPAGALAAVAAIAPAVAERFPRLTRDDQAMRPAEAVPRVLTAVASEAPVLLVIDDAEWLDAASADVVGALVRRPPARTLVALTWRADAAGDRPLAVHLREAASHVTTIDLLPLDVAELDGMLRSMMPLSHEDARRLAERLHRESAGNPAQVERLVATWADLGVLRVGADGRWLPTVPLDGELPLPVGLRETLAERMCHLSGEARAVAEAASVWNAEPSSALLEATSGLRGDQFAAALGELLSRRLLRESARRPGHHELASEATRRAIYDGLSPARRRALHAAAARALSAAPRDPERERHRREHLAKSGEPSRRRRVGAIAAVAATAVVVIAAGAAMRARSAAEVPRGADVVLADVVNGSEDSTLGRTFHTAASIGLQDSPHIALVPRARIRETLARMRNESADSLLTEQVAREVAIREGFASVIVLGVSQVDSSFLLTARLVNPQQGGDVGAHSVRVTGRGALLTGLDRLLAAVRDDLGESRLRASTNLPRITTSSLDALRAFIDARDAYGRQNFARARDHFEHAIRIDPEFALAHAFLSDVHWFGIGDRAAARTHLEHALARADRLTDRERLRIRGQAAARFGRADEATSYLEALAQRHPDRDTWYTLGSHYLQLRRCPDAIVAFRRSLAAAPRFQPSLLGLARCSSAAGDVGGALAAFDSLHGIDTLALVRGATNHEWGTALVQAGRLASADSAFRLMLARPGAVDRIVGRRSLAWLALHAGRYRDAADHLAAGIATARQSGMRAGEIRDRAVLAHVLASLGRTQAAAAQMDTVEALGAPAALTPNVVLGVGMIAVRLGRTAQAERLLRGMRENELSEVQGDHAARRTLESAILLARGDASGALRMADAEQGPYFVAFRRAVQADAYAALGRVDSAMVSARRLGELFAFGSEEQLAWSRAPLLLGRFAAQHGDTATARSAYAQFAARWAKGDRDVVDLVDARRALARLDGRRPDGADRREVVVR